MRVIVLILVFIIGGIIFISLENKRQNKIDRVCLEDLNLQLVGVVDTLEEGRNYHGYGIIRVKIINSNIQEYDPRSQQEFYFCIIKNGIAEIYTHTFVTKVDTITINTKGKIISYIKNGRKEEGSISINVNKDYYNYIKQKTIFK